MNIYELTGQYLALQEMIESGEYDEEVLADTLEGVEGELEVKAENYARIIRNFEGNIDAIKAEEKRLKEKRAGLENAVKRLKDTLQGAMIATDKRKFKTDLFSFSIAKNGGALPVILDCAVADLPYEFTNVTVEPDKKAIAEALTINPKFTSKYAHFGERGESLRIK